MAVRSVPTYKAGKRNNPTAWPILIIDMHNGDFTFAAQQSINMHTISAPNAMSITMDLSSGVSNIGGSKIKNNSAIQFLGDINYSYTILENNWNEKGLGNSFRKNLISEIPAKLPPG